MTRPAAPRDEVPEEGAWFRVEHPGATGAVRRAAARLAARLELPEQRAADLAIVVAEMTTNLVKHADEGALLLRPVRYANRLGVELIAVDAGPGMADPERSARDGHSTAGTLGIGLGAIGRLASWYGGYSRPGQGTVLAVQVWPAGPAPPTWAAGVLRPLTGEAVCGDGFACRVADGRHQVMLSDGLGHGPLAAAASRAAVEAFRTGPAAGPATVVEALHRALSATRGAAVAVAELDPAAGQVRFSGLGNVAGALLDSDRRRGMVSLPGIAGHQRRQIREYTYPLTPDTTVVLHSDGVTERWQPLDYPGLLHRAPQVVAAVVLRDAGVRRDDACVVTARAPA